MQEIFFFLKTLNSLSKWSILFIVYHYPGLSGRKISDLSGMGWAPIKNSLDELCKAKYLIRKKEGRCYAYFPNNDHILYPFLKKFFKELSHIHELIFKDLLTNVFQDSKEGLLTLKLTNTHLYLITLTKEVYKIEEHIRKHLEKRGLGKLELRLLPYQSLRIPEIYHEVSKETGRIFGLTLSQLMNLPS
ncbi:hypothetical protein [Thermosulfurimonas dismutans]|uniref:Uncharacterized protein n=1 Tax=Thermosulfurimonas dismutans TaxID=999894 RepID=A0A179D6D3_9BACT|nr:hypothetical protein [Thermosulfurimonas dismutans]OAQ21289.1 hypothetical protein TDIS_0509 [Thermosulfurimonas dismutans]